MSQLRTYQRPICGLLALIVLLLASCSLPSNPFDHGAHAGLRKGGSVTVALDNEPASLLPYQAYQPVTPMVDQAIWAPVWFADPNGILHPGLATAVPSMENGGISADLRTWTFHLKPGLKWSDGSPLTAEDCAFSYNLYADPAYHNADGFPTTDAQDPIGFQSATATDPTTVVIKIKRPFVGMNVLLADGASSCLPKAIWSNVSVADISRAPQTFTPTVTSGPFKLTEPVKDWRSGDHITVVRNPYYYQAPEKPYLDQITFSINSINAIVAAVQSGQADAAVPLDSREVGSYQTIPGYTIFADPQPAGYDMLIFNLHDPILSDIRVRKALIASFDTRQLTKLYSGTARLTCDDHGGTFAHEPSLIPCYTYDIAQAASLLDSAGWIMGADDYRHKDGKTLELDYGTTPREAHMQTEALAEATWKQIGIKIKLKVPGENPFGGLFPLLALSRFQMFELEGGAGYLPFNRASFDPDDHTMFASDQAPVSVDDYSRANYMRYSNPIVDAAERAQLSSGDPNARKAAFHIIHTQILQDAPVFYLYTYGNVFIHKNDVCGTFPAPVGPDAMWNVWDWNRADPAAKGTCPATSAER